MSYTSMYFFGNRGTMTGDQEFRNSHGSGAMVWGSLAVKYLGWDRYSWLSKSDDEAKPLWNLAKSALVTMNERLTLASTFDAALVKNKDMVRLAEAYEAFAAEHGNPLSVCHLPAMAVALRKAAADGVAAIGWNQTSVNGDVRWFPWSEKLQRTVKYNFKTKKDHFWVTESWCTA